MRLRIFSSSTCVGLRYGCLQSPCDAFLGSLGSPAPCGGGTLRVIAVPLFVHNAPTVPRWHLHPPVGYPSPSRLISITFRQRRNINLLPIAYAFRPRLRIRLTLGGSACPRKPWIFGGRESHTPYRYSYRHQHSQYVQRPLRYAFAHIGTLLYRTYFHMHPWLRCQT